MNHYFLQFFFLVIVSISSATGVDAQTRIWTEEMNGNKITMSSITVKRTYYLTDYRIPLNEELKRVYKLEGLIPARLNGDTIYCNDDIEPIFYEDGYSFTTYILWKMTPLLETLPDGDYELGLHRVVVDSTGKVVYYYRADLKERYSVSEFGICPRRDEGIKVSMALRKAIREELAKILKEIILFPASYNGKKVASVLLHPLFTKTIVVKDGKVSFL